jgi:hypothetical protein
VGRENQRRLLYRVVDEGFLPEEITDEYIEPGDVPELLKRAESNLELFKTVSTDSILTFFAYIVWTN